MNKRGQDLSIGTVILIVLGLAVLVFLVIGFTKGFDVFFGNIGTVDPGKVQVLEKACEGYAQAGLAISYCDFKEVASKKYLNCADTSIEPSVIAAGYNKIVCDAKSVENFCKVTGHSGFTANGQDCSTFATTP